MIKKKRDEKMTKEYLWLTNTQFKIFEILQQLKKPLTAKVLSFSIQSSMSCVYKNVNELIEEGILEVKAKKSKGKRWINYYSIKEEYANY